MENKKFLVSGLVKDKQHRLGVIDELEIKIAELEEQVSEQYERVKAIDLLLGKYDPTVNTSEIKKKRKSDPVFGNGELKKIVLELLKMRESTPATTKQIVDYAFKQKGKTKNKESYRNVLRQLRDYEEVLQVGVDSNNEKLWLLKRYAAEEKDSEKRAVVTRLRAPQ